MKKIKLEIVINASREVVWDSVVDPDKYRKWTRIFTEGSYFEGGWEKGDSIKFLVDKDGKTDGMISEIAESIYPEYISIKHLGMIKDGVADLTSDEVKQWAPSFENYKLEQTGAKTRFTIDMDIADEYYDMFHDLWARALVELKTVSEI